MARGRSAPRRRAPGHFARKSPTISGPFAERDAQLKASNASSPSCTIYTGEAKVTTSVCVCSMCV